MRRRDQHTGSHRWVRIHGRTTAGVDLEVEVVHAGVARRSDVADRLSLADRAARALPATQVGVEVLRPVVPGEPDRIATEPRRLEVDAARHDSHERRTARSHHVDALVAAPTRPRRSPRIGECRRTGDRARHAIAGTPAGGARHVGRRIRRASLPGHRPMLRPAPGWSNADGAVAGGLARRRSRRVGSDARPRQRRRSGLTLAALLGERRLAASSWKRCSSIS